MTTPRMTMGIIQLIAGFRVGNRSLRPRVAIINPRNMAPPSPIKILAGLKFQQRNPREEPIIAPASEPIRPYPFEQQQAKKKNDAIAVTPVHKPSMWSKILKAAVIPTTQKRVRKTSSRVDRGLAKKTVMNWTLIPEAKRMIAATGIAIRNLT